MVGLNVWVIRVVLGSWFLGMSVTGGASDTGAGVDVVTGGGGGARGPTITSSSADSELLLLLLLDFLLKSSLSTSDESPSPS